MDSLDACAVEDLLTAAGARCGHEGRGLGGVGDGLAECGEEKHLADGQGGFVVLFFVAKGTCHAAAAAGNDVELAPTEQTEHGGGLFDAHEDFQVDKSSVSLWQEHLPLSPPYLFWMTPLPL